MSEMQVIFSRFIENLAIDEKDLGEQITEWKECLEQRESIEFVRKSGSTKRGTSLNFSDVDIVVLFDSGRIDIGDLEAFFAIAEHEIKDCVRKLSKMDHGFKCNSIARTNIDIVIGYADDNNPLVFWIPDKRNGRFVWIETSPDASEKRIKNANRLTSGNAGKYVRLMKFWNYFRNKCFNSFYLETLIIKKILTDSEKFNELSYPEGLLYLFEYLIEAIEHKEPQPSGKGPHLGDLTVEEKRKIKQNLNYSIKMANLALNAEKMNEKKIYWENIFGYDLTR